MQTKIRSKPPVMSGDGVLTFGGVTEKVAYQITSTPAELRSERPGRRQIRGGLKASPATALAAFRAGRAHLTLEDGSLCRITVIAHTEGGGAAFFEIES
jgi:hypothetical protein